MSIFRINDNGTVTSDIYENVMKDEEIYKLKKQNEELLENIHKLETIRNQLEETIQKQNEVLFEKNSKFITECNNLEELIQFLRNEVEQSKKQNGELEVERDKLKETVQIQNNKFETERNVLKEMIQHSEQNNKESFELENEHIRKMINNLLEKLRNYQFPDRLSF